MDITTLDYESLVSAGQDLAITNAKNKARLGELVNVVTERWGDERVDDYSKDISEGDIKPRTLRSYRHVVTYYGSAAHVCRYIDQRVGWSVLRETASHFGDSGKDDAAAFLEHVMSSGITTYNETMRELKGATEQPRKPTLADELAADVKRLREACEYAVNELAAARHGIFKYSNYLIEQGCVTDALDAENGRIYRATNAIRDALTVRVVAAAETAAAGGA